MYTWIGGREVWPESTGLNENVDSCLPGNRTEQILKSRDERSVSQVLLYHVVYSQLAETT